MIATCLVLLAGDVSQNPGPGYCSLNDIRRNHGLKIAHLNVRSLRNKIDQLCLEGFDTNTFDVITLSETWLDQSIDDSEIALSGFTCVRRDRTEEKKGFGGVAVYVKDGLPFRVRRDLYSTDYECLWLEITREKCRTILVCCAYRAPDVNLADFISNLDSCMANIELDKFDFVLLGDLNANMLSHSRNKEKQALLKFIRTYGLMQLITKATRVGVTKAAPKTIEYRSYKNFNANSFIANEEDINEAVFIWNKLFTEVADQHAPVKRRRVKGTPLPWINNTINEAMKDRDFYHRKAKKTNSAQYWTKYRRQRNLVNREIKSVKSNYYCNLINEAKGDISKIWKAVNEASSRNVKSTSPQCIVAEGVQLTAPSSIAAAMNNYFASIGQILADKISLVSGAVLPTPVFAQSAFQLNKFDEGTVLNHLLSLKTHKAIGLDKISARLLKCGAHVICPSITRILNLSIRTGKFPEIWKCSKITALFKTGDRTDLTTYRPISILPTLSKILEKVVHNQFYEFLNSHNRLCNKQFGFRPRHCTATALSCFSDEVLLNMEQGNICGAVFLDLTKAIDTVDHRILLSKLSAIGVSPESLVWFESYLSHRKQRTSCDNELSETLPVTVGVPQGSILGPLLFNVYINSLPDVVKHSQV